jgi:hypothetical protein
MRNEWWVVKVVRSGHGVPSLRHSSIWLEEQKSNRNLKQDCWSSGTKYKRVHTKFPITSPNPRFESLHGGEGTVEVFWLWRHIAFRTTMLSSSSGRSKWRWDREQRYRHSFHPEDGVSTVLQTVGILPQHYEGVSKSFRTGCLERELQIVEFSATMCSCIAILWISIASFAAITLCVASERVFIVFVVYFVIDSVRKLLDTLSYTASQHRRPRLETSANYNIASFDDGTTEIPAFSPITPWFQFSWFYQVLQ